jgi:hypothetical protein
MLFGRPPNRLVLGTLRPHRDPTALLKAQPLGTRFQTDPAHERERPHTLMVLIRRYSSLLRRPASAKAEEQRDCARVLRLEPSNRGVSLCLDEPF